VDDKVHDTKRLSDSVSRVENSLDSKAPRKSSKSSDKQKSSSPMESNCNVAKIDQWKKEICSYAPSDSNHQSNEGKSGKGVDSNNSNKSADKTEKTGLKMELCYCHYKGEVEQVRLLAAYLDIQLDEKWPMCLEDGYRFLKELNGPFRNIPYIKDGDFEITEVPAMPVYMIRKAGRSDLLGNDLLEITRVRQLEGVIEDIRTLFDAVLKAPTDSLELMKKLLEPGSKVQTKIKELSDFLGEKEYFLGHLTWVDFLFVYLAELNGTAAISLGLDCPFNQHRNFDRVFNSVLNLPRLKTLHERRLDIEFFYPAFVGFKIKTIKEIMDKFNLPAPGN
jgi:glutathione S-transferase